MDGARQPLLERFSAHLKSEGLKNTRQRQAIADAFFSSETHISLNELLARAQKVHPGIGYATVYRTMKLMVECGLATEHRFTRRPKDGDHILEGIRDPVRRLIKHQRAPGIGERFQGLAPARGLRGEEAFETEAVCGQARGAQRGDSCTGSGDRNHCKTGVLRLADKSIARIGYQGCTGVGYQCDNRTAGNRIARGGYWANCATLSLFWFG